jgi:cysteine desulfurase
MKKINFDHMGYSPVLPEAVKETEKYLKESGGNPLSNHFMGKESSGALEEARRQVAGLINAQEEEIIFTSCGSESNNMALKGLLEHPRNKGKHIIASPIEHHSVLHPLKGLEKKGYEITWLKADSSGFVDPAEIKDVIREDTALITVTWASPEIGTLEPVEEIGAVARRAGVPFHTDAVAAAGRVEIDVEKSNIDMLTLASNPLYGPPGAAALYVRKGVRLKPLIEGGIQEGGLRAGTHNLPAIAGFGIAAREAAVKIKERSVELNKISSRIIDGVLENIPHTILTGDRKKRLPGHASVCIKYIEGESINLNLNMAGIASTSGSTCSSAALKVSAVLKAIGIDDVAAQGSIVFSAGIDNSPPDADYLVEKLIPVVEKLRKMSPVYPPDK